MALVYGWWWPLFAAIYPFLGWMVLTGSAPREDVLLWKIGGTACFALVGTALEWAKHPALHLSHLLTAWRLVPRHPAAALGLLVGIWALVAAYFSPDPQLALTGSVIVFERYGDSALWALLLSWVFVLVYLQSVQDPQQSRRMAWGGLVGLLLVALASAYELWSGKALHYYTAVLAELPLFTYPQQGHLAGVLALGAGLAGGLRAWWALAILAMAIGFTNNRAALVALGSSAVLQLRSGLRPALVAAVLMGAAAAGGWWLVSQQSVQASGSTERSLLATNTGETRWLMWKAALGGIAERPITGWGGGQVFARYWAGYLNDADLDRFLQLENNLRLVGKQTDETGTVLVVRYPNNEVQVQMQGLWKSHNWLLDAGVMYGVVGMILLVSLLLFTLRAWWNGNPVALGILTYSVFLMLWFPLLEVEGMLWALWGAAVVIPQKG